MQALRCLPGVGAKTAQRMTLHLLLRDRAGAERLAEAINSALRRIRRCSVCNTLTENEVCATCTDPKRDHAQLCIVESPSDALAIDQGAGYRGLFFILNGRLSPLDGIGPGDLGMERLEARLAQGQVQEVILATNTTVEGEATAHYISELARDAGVRVSRIAYGVPLGGELEYLDAATLAHALTGRRTL